MTIRDIFFSLFETESMKALIVDEPWISAILRGEKTWEMRKTGCNLRGSIALIRKGAGHVVGVAEVTDCLPLLGSRGGLRVSRTLPPRSAIRPGACLCRRLAHALGARQCTASGKTGPL